MPPTHAGLTDPRAYVRLAEIVRCKIIDGTLEPGRPAPSITRLSQEHGHARPTCGKALRMLEGEGPVRATVSCARELSREPGWLEPSSQAAG